MTGFCLLLAIFMNDEERLSGLEDAKFGLSVKLARSPSLTKIVLDVCFSDRAADLHPALELDRAGHFIPSRTRPRV
jgi:hypothetical protein